MTPPFPPELHGSTIGYINAGGRGTRLEGVFKTDNSKGIAKALLELGDPAVKLVDHHIARFHQQGFDSVVVAAGDQTEVAEYVNDTYRPSDGIVVTTSHRQQGTGGDLIQFARHIEPHELLCVQNVDTVLDIDLQSFIADFRAKAALGCRASIALTLARDVPNYEAYAVSENGSVVTSDEFSGHNELPPIEAAYRASSTGAVLLRAGFLQREPWCEADGQRSLYGDTLRRAWESESLFAYNNQRKFFRDVGTVATWLASIDDPELQAQLCYSEMYAER